MSLAIGGLFAGRYSIQSLLGEGGMGSVYRAHDAQLDRLVALKVVRLEGTGSTGGSAPNARARLLREARSAAAFAHPNAVAIFDVGEVDGVAYIAMELIEGRTLRTYIDDESAPLDVRIAWLRDIALALGAAHKRGIIHRDVKPENVMITREGTIKVLDFGIARRAETATDAFAATQKHVESLTGAGNLVGTPLYMAPEQIHGEELDARVDQFAWALMAHELFTGELPWGRERNVLSVVGKMFSQPPRSARDKVPEVPEEVQAAISRALSRSAAARFDTMEDLVASFAPAPTPSAQPAGVTRPSAWGRPRAGRMLRAIAAGAAVAAMALVVVLARSPSPSKPAPAAPASAPSADGAPRGHAITDLPLPESTHADALEAYKAALRYIRSANLDAARESLELALKRDPELAAANLRLIPIILDRSMTEDPALQFRRAMELRERLSQRDREILDAYAPVIETDPVDYKEAARRFDLLADAHPDDAEIALCLARMEHMRQDETATSRAVDRALALDPEYGEALLIKVEVDQASGRFAEGASDADDCFARFGSIDCLVERSSIAQFTGAPDAMAIARKQLGLTPDSPAAAEALAGALFVAGADTRALRAALSPARPLMSQRWQDCEDGVLAVLSGDFTQAHALFARWRGALPMFQAKQARAAWMLVTLDEEMGDVASALRDAELFVSQMPAFAGARGGLLEDEPIVPILRVLRVQGKLSGEAYELQRSAFIDLATSQTGANGRARVWLAAYAQAVRTPEEAIEALRVEPGYGEPPFHGMGGAPVGRVHLLAGDVAGAMPDLERGARATEILSVNPVAALQARLDLGHALEQSGDRAGACTQYDSVLSVWGAAVPTSVSATDARKRERSLSCPRKQAER